MLAAIMLVLTVLSVIWTWRLINFAIRTANRIAVASEANAAATQALYDALSDEAKQRANEARVSREVGTRAVANLTAAENRRLTRKAQAIALGIVFLLVVLMLIAHAV